MVDHELPAKLREIAFAHIPAGVKTSGAVEIAADEIEHLRDVNTELLAVLELVASEAYRLPSDCKRIITDEIAKAKGERT